MQMKIWTREKIEDAKKYNEKFIYTLNLYGDILFLSLFEYVCGSIMFEGSIKQNVLLFVPSALTEKKKKKKMSTYLIFQSFV